MSKNNGRDNGRVVEKQQEMPKEVENRLLQHEYEESVDPVKMRYEVNLYKMLAYKYRSALMDAQKGLTRRSRGRRKLKNTAEACKRSFQQGREYERKLLKIVV